MSSPKLKLLSLFSGAGGFDLGFEKTGYWETVAAFDNHPVMIETLKKNKGLALNTDSHFLRNA